MKKIQILLMYIIFCLCACSKEDAENIKVDQTTKGIYPLESLQSLDVLINQIGDARYVMLGEASHGTSEFYTWRAEISKRLIQEKGFTMIAVEGDWPDAFELNRYIKGYAHADKSPEEVLQAFNRWPTWMWANQEIAQLAQWLKEYNQGQPVENKAGFYGMDVYSLWESMDVVMEYLEKTDPEAANTARAALQCFAPYQRDEYAYASATVQNPQLCADELASLLEVVRAKVSAMPATDEEAFNLEQNALVAVNAERYYNAMVTSNSGSWNIRDNHMMETINRLMQMHGPTAKIIIWAHNTHVGDARATDMAREGSVNIGQLAREQHSNEEVYLVGFGTYQGTVIAAREWGAPTQNMNVPAAQAGSWEAILHSIQPANKILIIKEMADDPRVKETIGHRAIGVAYNPSSEYGNYVPTVLAERYDAFLFIDQTQALHPLNITSQGGRKAAEALANSFLPFLND